MDIGHTLWLTILGYKLLWNCASDTETALVVFSQSMCRKNKLSRQKHELKYEALKRQQM